MPNLVTDGRQRSVENIFGCLKAQWEALPETTKMRFHGHVNKIASLGKGTFVGSGFSSADWENADHAFYKVKEACTNLSNALELGELKVPLSCGKDFFTVSHSSNMGSWDLLAQSEQKRYDEQVKEFKEKDAQNSRTTYACKFCLTCHSELHLLQRHLIKKHPDKCNLQYNCSICSKTFNSRTQLLDHSCTKTKRAVHIRRQQKNAPVVAEMLKNFCSDCHTKFETVSKYKYHRLKVHGKWQGDITCPDCDKTYGTESNLRKHLRKSHGKGPLNSSLKRCSECNFTSYDSYNLKVHMRKHTGERPFVCGKCQFGFYKKSDLTTHLKTCKGVLRSKCDKCNEVFHFHKALEKHLSWSESCGSIRDKVGQLETSPMVRLNTETKSILAINCDDIADNEIFTKLKKRAKCGICTGCERASNCEECNPCQRKTSRTQCTKRKCINLIPQFDVKKDQRSHARHILQRFTSMSNDNIIDDHAADVFLNDSSIRMPEFTPQSTVKDFTDLEHTSSTDNLMLLTEAASIDYQDMILVHSEEVVETNND